MYGGGNFDALATGKWDQIESRQVVFLHWMHDSNPESLETNLQQTECTRYKLTEPSRIKLKTWTQ